MSGTEISTGVGDVCASGFGCSGLRVPQAPEGGPFGIAREDATRKSRETSACRAMAYSKDGRGTVRVHKNGVGLFQLRHCLRLRVLSQQATGPGCAESAANMSSFDKALKSLTPQDAKQWQELKNGDWMRSVVRQKGF